MLRITLNILLLLIFYTPTTIAKTSVEKSYCMASIGYHKSIENLKKEILINVKRLAVNEIFGELITSFTMIADFQLTEDNIRASSAGFIRIKGDPVYYQGQNLGDVCVKINAYAKDEDFAKFKPKVLSKKSCLMEGDVKEIKKKAQQNTKLEALIDYDQSLANYPQNKVLPLLHEVTYDNEGFVNGTSVYCVKASGKIYPIEIASLKTAPNIKNKIIAEKTVTTKKASPLNKPKASQKSTSDLPSQAITWNFETGDLSGWTATGNAFEFQPTYGDNSTARNRGQPSRHQGHYWIGGYEKRPLPSMEGGMIQGDEPMGTLISDVFTLPSKYISFLIGGGCHINRVRVELIINGKVVAQATGKCTETMTKKLWNVSQFLGQQAQIKIIDASSSGWGHLNFDDLRFE